MEEGHGGVREVSWRCGAGLPCCACCAALPPHSCTRLLLTRVAAAATLHSEVGLAIVVIVMVPAKVCAWEGKHGYAGATMAALTLAAATGQRTAAGGRHPQAAHSQVSTVLDAVVVVICNRSGQEGKKEGGGHA